MNKDMNMDMDVEIELQQKFNFFKIPSKTLNKVSNLDLLGGSIIFIFAILGAFYRADYQKQYSEHVTDIQKIVPSNQLHNNVQNKKLDKDIQKNNYISPKNIIKSRGNNYQEVKPYGA